MIDMFRALATLLSSLSKILYVTVMGAWGPQTCTHRQGSAAAPGVGCVSLGPQGGESI